MIDVGFIGAGNRATRGHYPAVTRLADARIAAICDLDESRLAAAGDAFGVARRYTDYHAMLADTALDAVYVIMPPMRLAPIVIDCLSAGKHVFMEKPPGMSVAEVEAMIAVAELHGCRTMVALQRRFTAVVEEVKRLVEERGPVTMCLAEFHKHMLDRDAPPYGISTLLEDVIHVVDLTRALCGGEATAVHAFRDRFFADWTNCYTALVRFSSGAVGVIAANRAAGARSLRCEVHGRGISAYLRLPEVAEVWRDDEPEPVILRGSDLVGADDPLLYEGTLAANRHFIECIQTGREPRTSLQHVLGTMRLVEAMEGAEHRGTDRLHQIR